MLRSPSMAVAVAVTMAGLGACGGRTGLLGGADGGPADRSLPSMDRAVPAADRALPDRAWRPDPGFLYPDRPRRPCSAPLASAQLTVNSKMVVCRLTQGPWLNQCQAEIVCGPGWRLCKASEYQKQFGQSAGPPNTETSWLAGCVLSDGNPHAPRDEVCASCSGPAVKAPIIAWHCTKDMAAFVQRRYAGLVSYPECMRVGVKSYATAAHWAANAPDYKLRQAFCCR